MRSSLYRILVGDVDVLPVRFMVLDRVTPAAFDYSFFDKEHLAALKPNSDWYPPSIFFQGMQFMLFGDPSLRLPANHP